MHLHGPALDHRLEHMPLQHLHGEDDPERPQRDHEPPVGERDQHGHRAGEERAEVRDVRADEDERAEPDRARHAAGSSRPTVMQIASMSAMNVVPRMKPSTAWKARRAIASTVSPVPRGRERAQGPGGPVRSP